MGLPLPAESMLVASGVYAGTTGHLSIVPVVTAASIGAIVGDNIGYLIGRTLGYRALQRWGKHVGLTEDRQTLGRYLFKRHGAKVSVLCSNHHHQIEASGPAESYHICHAGNTPRETAPPASPHLRPAPQV
jgi:hypothetical protein